MSILVLVVKIVAILSALWACWVLVAISTEQRHEDLGYVSPGWVKDRVRRESKGDALDSKLGEEWIEALRGQGGKHEPQ
jgi:hypothetical protein